MKVTTIRVPMTSHKALAKGPHRRQGFKIWAIYQALVRAYLAEPSIIDNFLLAGKEEEGISSKLPVSEAS